MPGHSALPHPQRGALPPAFGSPRDIFGQMKDKGSPAVSSVPKYPRGVRRNAPRGADSPPATPATGRAA
jgi:hypothetical protein